MLGDVTDR